MPLDIGRELHDAFETGVSTGKAQEASRVVRAIITMLQTHWNDDTPEGAVRANELQHLAELLGYYGEGASSENIMGGKQ